MAKSTRLLKSFIKLLLPVLVLIVLAVMVSSVWFVHTTAEPPRSAYLVTPEKYGRLSSRGAQVTDEKWQNRDSSESRGWLLKGSKGKPAVILLHRYGADRSHVLNLGVRLNEATDFTVLMPDARGHGQNPLIRESSFGGCEVEDTLAAVDYLKSIRGDDKKPLIANSIGIYGVEMGGLVALSAASRLTNVKALAVDSVPQYSNEIMSAAIEEKFPFASSVTSELAKAGSYIYYARGCYERSSVCDIAKSVEGRDVLLLAGNDTPALRSSTSLISGCFPNNSKVTTFTEMTPSGVRLTSATLEQVDSYEQKVIYFFKSALEEPNSE
jgi:pimeloyl-ACP methyl ester carboxylesterase